MDLNLRGIVLALSAGVCYATYAVAHRELVQRAPTTVVTALVLGVAALMVSPLLIGRDLRWLGSLHGVCIAGYLGLAATAFAYLLYAYGLRFVRAPEAITLSLAEPLTATALGIGFLREPFTLRTAIGAAILVIGIALLALAGIDNREQDALRLSR